MFYGYLTIKHQTSKYYKGVYMEIEVKPGIHPQIHLDHFSVEEKQIIECLSKYWFVTNSGKEFTIGFSSKYKYLLLKPTKYFNEMFNLDREIIALFSMYETFEPRTIDAITTASKMHQDLRLEKICSILISKDSCVESKLRDLLKNDKEAKIIIPFSYSEMTCNAKEPFFFRNRFISHFYSRDLFAIETPLKTDLYFFGRLDLIHKIVDRFRTGQVSGLFGLRKTGKTSVIFGIQRALDKLGDESVFIDCQSPSFHRCRWNIALYYVLSEIKRQIPKITTRLRPEENFIEEKAAILFEETISHFSNDLGGKKLLLIFDEIENITFSISPSVHWGEGLDFVFFWQTLRSIFQKSESNFAYLLVGTNPLCVEMEKILGKDNPIFGQIPLEYIPRFDVPQTREMVRRLGRIMGMQFDEVVYGMLNEDFGGHPYLIRHVCSVLNSLLPSERPGMVDKALYIKGKNVFIRNYGHFIDMILNVLKDHFSDEYEMANYLANGDNSTFEQLAAYSPLYTNHLIGYGIIEVHNNTFTFRIDSIKEHLISKSKYRRLNLNTAEMLAEISERRNKIEQSLRVMCRIQLQTTFGATDARTKVLDIFGEPRKSKFGSLSYNELFNANVSMIYFLDLEKIITKFWDSFKNVLWQDKDEVISFLRAVNKYRSDAHAKDIDESSFRFFRVCADKIEKVIRDYL
jgi:hypothetical protein